VNYSQGCGNDEGSQLPGGVGVGRPGFRLYCDRLGNLIDQLVESDVQKANDVQLKLRFLQQSTEYFLGSEDYVRPDTCCLSYDVDLAVYLEKIAASVAEADCNY